MTNLVNFEIFHVNYSVPMVFLFTFETDLIDHYSALKIPLFDNFMCFPRSLQQAFVSMAI